VPESKIAHFAHSIATMSAAVDLDRLRTQLEKQFGSAIAPLPGRAPERERAGFRAGVRALDQLLPAGVPRRAATLWTGEATSGRTAALRALVWAACRRTRVALVDATRTLDPADWCGPDGRSHPALWVARPPAADRGGEGAWVAEQLLRTGAFGLVVLDGPPPDPVGAHRLRALARETDAALLVSTGEAGAGWRADLRLEFRRDPAAAPGLRAGARFRRRSHLRAAKVGSAEGRTRAVELAHEPPSLVRPAPCAGDRRPAARA